MQSANVSWHKPCRARWAGLPLSTFHRVQLAGEDSANATSEMSSTEAHIKLVNTLMASDRVWEATIDSLPDAVYIFGAARIPVGSPLLRHVVGFGRGWLHGGSRHREWRSR